MLFITKFKKWVNRRVDRWIKLHELNALLKEFELSDIFKYCSEITFITRNGARGKILRSENELHSDKYTGKVEQLHMPCITVTWNNKGKVVKLGSNPNHVYDISKIVDFIESK